MRVDCLVTGQVRAKAGERGLRRYLAEEWRDEAMPVNAFVIYDPAGICLFDAGQTARAARPGWFPGWQPFFHLSRFELAPHDEVAPQLRERGIEPLDVARVVLSHLHTDHVGGLDAFAHAEVIVSRVEWRRANGLGGRIRGYLPQHWPNGLRPRLVDFTGPPVGPFEASHALAGDNRLVLVPAPGHTPGHAALLIRDGETRLLLAGDLAHTAADVARVAPAVAAWCAEEGIRVLTAHDPSAPMLA